MTGRPAAHAGTTRRATRIRRRAGASAPRSGTGAAGAEQPATPGPTRVAIVGGGCAGIAAAWHLSRLPGYDVTVYERSWRLGGKGASGRTPDGRIVEHGLHVWLGFYENAFRMIRECYDEVATRGWGPSAAKAENRLAHGRFEDAFFPEPHIGVTGVTGGEHVVWSGMLPPEPGLPGDDIRAHNNPFTIASYLQRCVHLLKTLVLSVVGRPEQDVPGSARPDARSPLDERIDLDFSLDPSASPEVVIESVASRVRGGTLTLAAGVLQAVTILESVLQDLNHSPQIAGSVLNVLRALAGQARKQLRDFVAIDPQLRWKTEIIDIVMTIVVGLYRDRVLLGSKGFDSLNNMDYREWLRKHGATTSAINSRFVTGIYDLVFAYEGGDRNRPRLAAGVALRGALRMFFTYRGAMFWRMRSGMGDAVFAPLYKVMSRPPRDAAPGSRPVKFHFFHDLQAIEMEAAGKDRCFITGLTFGPAEGARLVKDPGDAALDHAGCWPETGDHLLGAATGSRQPLELRAGQDFDLVILAMGLDDFAHLIVDDRGRSRVHGAAAPEVWQQAAAEPRPTVATKAAQIWLDRDLEELGWFRGSAIISAFGREYPPVDPDAPPVRPRPSRETDFDTWADMTHTLPSERAWRRTKRRARAARSVAYFCGVMPDAAAGRKPGETVTGSLNAVLARMHEIWPDAGAALSPLARHVQENVQGSDRYSQSLPGRINNRLSPLDGAVLNAAVAGDWTACGLDAGCVEAAVISGMLAVHAMTGSTPPLEAITGYDHP